MSKRSSFKRHDEDGDHVVRRGSSSRWGHSGHRDGSLDAVGQRGDDDRRDSELEQRRPVRSTTTSAQITLWLSLGLALFDILGLVNGISCSSPTSTWRTPCCTSWAACTRPGSSCISGTSPRCGYLGAVLPRAFPHELLTVMRVCLCNADTY